MALNSGPLPVANPADVAKDDFNVAMAQLDAAFPLAAVDLGTDAVEKIKIKDGNVSPVKLEAINSPNYGDAPRYDQPTGKFVWTGVPAASELVSRGDPAGWDKTQATLTCDGAWHDWDLSSIVGSDFPIAVLVSGIMSDDAVGSYISFRFKGYANSINAPIVYTQAVNATVGIHCIVFANDKVIQYNCSNVAFANISIAVIGWWR